MEWSKGQAMIYKTLHRKQRSSNSNHTKNRRWIQVLLVWSSSCSTSSTSHVTLVTNPVISHEWGKNWIVIMTNRTYLWSFVTQMFRNGESSHGINLTTTKKQTKMEWNTFNIFILWICVIHIYKKMYSLYISDGFLDVFCKYSILYLFLTVQWSVFLKNRFSWYIYSYTDYQFTILKKASLENQNIWIFLGCENENSLSIKKTSQ